MNAKRRTLAVLAAVIAVLGLALWALNRSTAAEEAASSAAADGTIPLCSFSTADLSRITYTYNGQTLTLDDADGSWTLAEDSDYHLDESACNTMVTALSSLHAKRQLDAQAGEDYGFDAPELTVTVTAAGQTTTLTFGSSNTVTGDRYVQKDGDTALYTVDASRTACFACDKAGLFGSFSPAGFAVSDVEQVPREVLLRFVSELPEGYRAVFNLYCIEEYSHREIARMLGINEKSSSSQLFRARALLARKIRAYLESH